MHDVSPRPPERERLACLLSESDVPGQGLDANRMIPGRIAIGCVTVMCNHSNRGAPMTSGPATGSPPTHFSHFKPVYLNPRSAAERNAMGGHPSARDRGVSRRSRFGVIIQGCLRVSEGNCIALTACAYFYSANSAKSGRRPSNEAEGRTEHGHEKYGGFLTESDVGFGGLRGPRMPGTYSLEQDNREKGVLNVILPPDQTQSVFSRNVR